MILAACLAPLAVQGLLMLFDEFHFHWKRGLPRWERLGHPLDTLSTLGCFLVPATAAYSGSSLALYVGVCVFSCLFVTKDEWVHARHCEPAEHWLHAMLFVVHPLVFMGTGILWALAATGDAGVDAGTVRALARGQVALLGLFLCYQVIFWIAPGRGKRIAPADSPASGSCPPGTR